MNVKELKDFLNIYPDDMEVVMEYYENSENGTCWPVEDRVESVREGLASARCIENPKIYPYRSGKSKNAFYKVVLLT